MKKVFLSSVFASVCAPVLMMAGVTMATAPVLLAQSAPSDQITIKNPAEYNAYNNAITQTDPKTKASAIEGFLQTYPDSVVKKAVLDVLLDTDYAVAAGDKFAAADLNKTIDTATKLLQLEPNNLKAMYLVVFFKNMLAGQAAQAGNTTQQGQMLDDAAAMATKGLAATKPAEVKPEDFAKQKASTDPLFYSVLSNDQLYGKKDLPGAIAAFRKELEYLAANNPEATKTSPALSDTLILGQTYTQLSPPDMVNGVWFLARAENFAPAGYKPVIDKQAKYWYKRFHGGEDGYDKVLALAATTIFPPPDFKIAPAPTPLDIANKFVADNPDFSTYALGDSEYVLSHASPENAEKLWATLKDKVTQIPGVVIAATASQLQVAVTDDAKADKKADFTVNMKEPLKDAEIPAVGSTETNLIGTYDSYTQNPAQIIMRDGELQVEKKKPVAHKPSAAHKKAS